ncbi:MAG TPA: hypothetical protein DD381_00975 [Lentisphaeria bacterium]|nr:MAG: hypothetical protein A2X47_13835 [Lentisphaerae bacterium GWF2_38_69]HBM14915.1 hypothetical protein [Lentisphaeria bacterium]
MKKTQDKSESAALLRQKAEERLRKLQKEPASKLNKADTLKLLHELQVHQIELEMQNEELKATKQELEIAKIKYFELFDQAPMGYFMLDEKLIILEANLTASYMLSAEIASMVKKPFSSFIFPADKDLYYIRAKKLLTTLEYQVFEIRAQKEDGKELWVTIRFVPLHDGIDKQLFIVTISDITELKELQHELIAAKNEEFKIVFDSVPDGIIIADMETKKFNRGNEAICRMLGYSGSEIANLSVLDIHPEKDLPYVIEHFEKQAKGEYSMASDLPVKRKDGTVFYADINATHIKIDGKSFLMGLFHDTTERKKTEEALHFNNTLLSTQLEASNDGILVVDKHGKIIYSNQRFIEIWEIPVEVMASKSDEKALKFVLENLASPDEFIKRVKYLYEHKEEKSEEEVSLNDGRILYRFSSPINSKEGTYFGRIWFFSDITALKNEQKDRLSLEKQLFQSQKMEAIGALTGGIVHDMNNILASISAFASLFQSEYSKKDGKSSYIQNIQELAARGAAIVNQIRNFAKPKNFSFEPIDIKPIIESTLKLLATKIKYIAKVSVTVIPKQRLPIMGDATQIGQMLLNILSNSCDAMEGKWGKLDIIIDEVSFMEHALPLPELKPGRHLKLTIIDTGNGITPEVKKHLFEPFFTTKGEKGTGIGLSIVKRVISIHNGAISVESTPGKGTVFNIYFPVVSNI